MHFSQIPNAALSNDSDRPMMQKEAYPVSAALQQYLSEFKRDHPLPLGYKDLLHYDYSNAIKDEKGKHTHWERVVYEKKLFAELEVKLLTLFSLLKQEPAGHITISSIDFCEFANSMPFRINLINSNNNTADYFYVKNADASRIYGLELEQLLTVNRINFLYHQNTLVEEHIEGIPGDDFAKTLDQLEIPEKKLLAEEFVRFNERCFTRLLGDMRSYNFVLVKQAGSGNPFTLKAIDFDQQCYEGKLNLYLPQFYKENLLYVELATQLLSEHQVEAIRIDERKIISGLAGSNNRQLNFLLTGMKEEELSENYKVTSLRKELNKYHHTQHFDTCKTMGAIVDHQLKQILELV